MRGDEQDAELFAQLLGAGHLLPGDENAPVDRIAQRFLDGSVKGLARLRADGFIVIHNPPTAVPGHYPFAPLEVSYHHVSVEVTDQVAVTSGINPGDEVVTSGVFKLRNGAAVLVNNAVKPGNNPAAKPENS